MTATTETLLGRRQSWPAEDPEELAEYACEIKARREGAYCATRGGLAAIEKTERSGRAGDEDVKSAPQSFRRA